MCWDDTRNPADVYDIEEKNRILNSLQDENKLLRKKIEEQEIEIEQLKDTIQALFERE